MKQHLQTKRTLIAILLVIGILVALGGSSFGAIVPQDLAPSGAATCTVFQPAKGAGQDSFLEGESGHQDHNKGTDTELKVKTENGKLMRSVLQFDISGLPAGAVVDSATLSLWVKDVRDGNVNINAHALNTAWNQHTVTWNTPWTTPGGDYGATVSTTAFTKGVKNYWAIWDVSTAASGWLSDPTSNYGVILEQSVTNPKSEVKFKSNNESSDRPKLEICWRPGVTLEPDNAAEGTAGATSSYAHVLSVGAVVTDTYVLSASSSLGWTTRIYADVDEDGVKDDNTVITQTVSLTPDSSYGIVVEIDVPGAADVVIDVTTVSATGQTNGRSDSATDTTSVGTPPFTEPVIDGLIDPAYLYNPNSSVQDYCSVETGETLASVFTTYDVDDPSYDNVYIVLAMDRSLVDNTYGANKHPSWTAAGKSPTLGSLRGSDKAQFDLFDGNGTLLYSPLMDYVEDGLSTPSGWGSGGITEGEGDPDGLNPAYFTGESSEGYNLNEYCPGGLAGCTVGGVNLENDSPPIDLFYVPTNPIFNDWEFTYLYEFAVDPAAFGAAGFGKVTIPYTHVSPNKVGSNEIPVEPCEGSIGDLVWQDVNSDGIPQAGESGLNGVQVRLYKDNGDDVFDAGTDLPRGAMLTSGDGDYDFTGLGPNTYWVQVNELTVPAGFALTTNNNPLMVPLAVSEDFNDADFGYAGKGSIGNYVWNDANGNGIQDEGPGLGINGATVNLYRENGDNVCDAADLIPANFATSAVTAGDGDYILAGLSPDVYCVDVDESTMPGGYEFIPGLQSGPQPLLVDLDPQENYTAADFGYAGRGNITGVVFFDWNEDGVQGIGEPGIAGVDVCLYNDVNHNGQYDDGLDTQVSCQPSGNSPGSEGFYNFTNNLPGDYVVVQDPIPGLDSTTGRVRPVTLVVVGASGSNNDNDFGNIVYSSIGDFIYLDTNGNGKQDPGETQGVPGVPITLTNLDTLAISVTVSAGDGSYLFPGLLPGAYTVQAPFGVAGIVRTTPTPLNVNLGIAEDYLDADIGYIAPTSVALAGFAVSREVKGVNVQWVTTSETNQVGFRILRSNTSNGAFKAVSPVITALNLPTGGSYQWFDTSATLGQTYWYKLESLPDGELFGPIPSRDFPGVGNRKLFLPAVAR